MHLEWIRSRFVRPTTDGAVAGVPAKFIRLTGYRVKPKLFLAVCSSSNLIEIPGGLEFEVGKGQRLRRMAETDICCGGVAVHGQHGLPERAASWII